MKRFFAVLLMVVMILSLMPLTFVSANGENILKEADSTFESGKTSWKVFGAGNVEVVNNPDGDGKVLKFSGVPEDKGWASPALDVKPYITDALEKSGTVTIKMDVYSEGAPLKSIFRIRVSNAGDFSMCQDKNYCQLSGNVSAGEGEWVNTEITFDVLPSDLKSSANAWNFCFDGAANSAMDDCALYIDNVVITVEEKTFEGFEEEKEEESGDVELITDTSSLPISNTVATGNVVSAKDATFESGEAPTWKAFSGGNLLVVANPDGEGRVLAYKNCPIPSETENNNTWASPALDIKPYIQANITESGKIYVAFDVYCAGGNDGNIPLVIRASSTDVLSLADAKGSTYVSIGKADFVVDEWVRLNAEFELEDEDLTVEGGAWNLCFDNTHRVADTGVVFIDNLYIGATPEGEDSPSNKGQIKNNPIPEKTPITRSKKTLVGTIRWDAFTKSTANGSDPASQVARVLSPAKYHNQAPFFSIVNEDNTIAFPEYTVATWEYEMEYAVKGGLDYFAYLWYESNDAMSQPRKAHLKSAVKDKIKMAGILESLRGKKTMDELFAAMKDSCYLTLDGRPVVYLYEVGAWSNDDIIKLRQMAANAGIDKALYIIAMNIRNETSLSENMQKDFDAFSWYGTSANKSGESFESLSARCEELMVKVGGWALALGKDIIPSFTVGADTRARVETGVTWVDGDPNATEDKDKPYGNRWSYQPTPDELEKHFTNVYNYVQENPEQTKANLILSYGWNEHEEGGWLCPTLLCDETGNPIKDENGNNIANDERLRAINKALVTLRGDKPYDGENTIIENTDKDDESISTPAPETDEQIKIENQENKESEKEFNILFVIIPAVVVILGAVVAIIIKKKK